MDKTWDYEWETVPAGWKALDRFRVIQQVELVEKPYIVSEHRARLYQNLRTGQVLAAPLPKEVRRAGLLGPRLTALVAYQKGACHMSVETVRRFLADVFQLPISHGQVLKTVQKASAAMAPCYEQLQQALPQQASMGIDETGHRERGRGLWSWCFHVPGQNRFTWFHIDPSRGSKVLKRYLGKTFRGIVGCDYFSAYRKFLRESDAWLQLCWAHLIRDVKYLTTLLDRATRNYGHRLLSRIKTLFRTWHRRGETPAIRWERAAAKARREVLAVARRAPCGAKPKTWPSGFVNMATRISPSWTCRASNRPTTAPSVKSVSSPSTAKSPKARAAKLDAVGASAFGRHSPPAPNKPDRPSISSTTRSSPTSPTNPSPPSYLYLRDRIRVYQGKNGG